MQSQKVSGASSTLQGLAPLVVMATGLRQKRVIFTVNRERDQTVSNRTSAPLVLKECFFEVVTSSL